MLDFLHFSTLINVGLAKAGLITPNARERAKNEAAARSAADLLAVARLEAPEALAQLESAADGLNPEQVEERLEKFGPNIVAQEKKQPVLLQLAERFYTNPINILLTVLAVITWVTGDQTSDKIGALI